MITSFADVHSSTQDHNAKSVNVKMKGRVMEMHVFAKMDIQVLRKYIEKSVKLGNTKKYSD